MPANTTDQLQPLDISVNKPAKEFLKRKFEQWYFWKDIGTTWWRWRYRYRTSRDGPCEFKPSIDERNCSGLVGRNVWILGWESFVYSFIRSGICGALDGCEDDEQVEYDADESDGDDDIDFDVDSTSNDEFYSDEV